MKGRPIFIVGVGGEGYGMEGCCSSPALSSLSYALNKTHLVHASTKNQHKQFFIPQILLSKCKKCMARKHLWSHFSSDRKKTTLQLRNGNGVKITSGVLPENISHFSELQKQSDRIVQCSQFFPFTLSKLECVIHPEKSAQVEQWRKKLKRRCSIFLIGSAIALVFMMSISVNMNKNASRALTEENLLFLEAWRTIDRAYIDKTFNGQRWFRYREDALRQEPMNTREETYAAIRKMLATLDDPFTRFLEPEKFKSLRSGTTGALTGVGLEVGIDMASNGISANLIVISPVAGGPADRAGVMPGDKILAINGTSTQGMGLYDAAEQLQGPEDSVVELVLHKGDSESRIVSLKREKITLNPVSWHLCEVSRNGKSSSRIGYIRLTTFNQNASGAVKEAIETLRENNVNSFVLDLRNNSGGLFPEGIKIAKIWLDKSVIVYICDSKGIRDIYETDGTEAVATSEPLVVLVNKGTASASEILAAALKDNKRAVLLGEPTFGKGKIQSVFELSDGSAMAVTIARYETPSHTDINKVGVIPDQPLPPTIPIDGDGFCKCLEGRNSACNINTTAFLPK